MEPRNATAPVTQVIARRPRQAAMKNLPHRWMTMVKKNSSTLHRCRPLTNRPTEEAWYHCGPSSASTDTELVDHPLTRHTQRNIVELLGPVQTHSQHLRLPQHRRSRSVEVQRRPDGPVLAGQHPRRRPTSAGHPRGRRLTSVLAGQASEAFLG